MKETRFKDTEVGVISKDWEVLELHEVISHLRTGLNPRANFSLNTADASGYYITVRELKGFDIEIDEKTNRINNNAASQINERSKLKTNDVLFSGTGTIGQTAIVRPKTYDWGIKEGIYAITPKQNQLNSVYLILYFQTPFATSLINSYASGSTVRSVPMSKLEKMPIPIPPLSEQTCIASVLTSVDNLLTSLGKLIEKKRAIKQGAMQMLLTGKKRLKGFDGEWVEKRLGEVSRIYDGTHQTPHYVENGVPFYSVENVTANDFVHTKYISEQEHATLSSRIQIEQGDVLMTRIGSIGNCKYVDWKPKASFYVSLALIKCTDSVDAKFISYYSNSKLFKKEIELRSLFMAIPQKINLGPIADIIMIIPSSKEEQSAIASVLTSMDNEIIALETKKAKYEAIKQGMMQQLLTGRIRLVE